MGSKVYFIKASVRDGEKLVSEKARGIASQRQKSHQNRGQKESP